MSHIGVLRGATDVAYTCEAAIRHQNADGDRQIANVMRLYCGNKLYAAMTDVGALVLLLDGKIVLDLEESEEIAEIIEDTIDR
jgi:hypothetical protein